MIKITLDLSQATKAEYDTYMASGLHQFITTNLNTDLAGCQVEVNSPFCPHSVQRFASEEDFQLYVENLNSNKE